MLETLWKTRALLGGDRLGKWAWLVVLALVAAVFEAVGALVVFALLRRITTEQSGFELPLAGDVREIFPGVGDTTLLVIVGVVVAGFFVARAALLVAQSYLQSRVTENASADLATRLVAGYLAMPYPFLLKRNSAELIRNTFDTVQQYARDALSPAVRLISQSLVALTLVAVLLAMSPWATLLAVGILGPFSWLLLRVIHPRVKRYGAISQEVSRQNLQTLDECLSGWRDIKILGRERFFAEQFAHDRQRLARIRYLSSTLREIPRVAIETGLVLFILAFLGVNALVNDGALEALPVLGLFGYVAVRLQPSLTEIMTALNSLKFVGPGIDLIYRDLLLFPAEAPAATRQAPLSLQREIRFEDVSMRYEGAHRDALIGVDLTIRAGEFVGIVGPTGGGKSTLVDALLGLLTPTSGRVTVDGVDTAAARRRGMRASGSSTRRCSSRTRASAETLRSGSGTTKSTTRSSRRPSGSRSSSSSSRRFPTGSKPLSASAACACQAGSASVSRSRGPSTGSRACSCSTRARPRSTSARKVRVESPCALRGRRQSSWWRTA